MMTPRDDAASAAFQALDGLQRFTPEEQLAGAALLFSALRTRCGLDPFDLSQLGDRLLAPEAFHDKANWQLEALRDYAGLRIAGDPNVSTM